MIMAYINHMRVTGIEHLHAFVPFPVRRGTPVGDIWPVKDVSRAPGYRAEMPSPVFLALWYVTAGAGEVRTDGRTMAIAPGDVLVCPPDVARTIEVTSPTALRQLIVLAHRARVLDRVAGILGHLPAYVAAGGENVVGEYMERLLAEALRGETHSAGICDALLNLVLQHIARARFERVRAHGARARFEHCRGIIRDRCEELCTLGELATACGMHRGSLCRLFKLHGARSPYQKLSHAKMTRAAELLLSTDVTVREVGARVGYTDPYEFSRAFKRVMHVSPKPYRERGGSE